MRFISELATRDVTSEAIFKQKGAAVFLIFDQQVRDRVKQTSAAFELGLAYEATTLHELAKAMGLDPATLQATIARYNGFVDAKADADFKRPDLPRKVEKGPFYGIEVRPAVHYTMGGLKFNRDGQVIDTKGQPIRGLYAVGEVTGGVHGANRLGGNSISQTITFGRLVGESAALAVRGAQRP